MHRNKLACSMLVLAVAASMWACSDDDTDPVGAAGSGGAHAGSGGKGGSGGAKAGSGGKPAQGGEDTGGAGEGGAVEVAGAGGDSAGGAGGAGGDSSESGAGGEGGAPPALSLEEACAAVCSAEAGLTCNLGTGCQQNCVDTSTAGTDQPELYDAMIVCLGQHLTADNYYCSDSGPPSPFPAPKGDTSCESKICAWTCADLYGAADANVYARCNCAQ